MFRRRIDTLIVTGSETDMRVLSTELDAMDYGYRAIVSDDAICSSSDSRQRAMTDYRRGFSMQAATATAAEVMKNRRP